MLSFSVEDVLLLVVVWLACNAVYSLLFTRFVVMRYAGMAVINKIVNPDEDTQEAINSLIGMIAKSEIQTDKVITDPETGKTRPERIPFVIYVGREIWQYLGMLRKASTGGKTKSVADEFGMSIGPRKGQSTAEYLTEQLVTRMGPKLDEIIGTKLDEIVNKRGM